MSKFTAAGSAIKSPTKEGALIQLAIQYRQNLAEGAKSVISLTVARALSEVSGNIRLPLDVKFDATGLSFFPIDETAPGEELSTGSLPYKNYAEAIFAIANELHHAPKAQDPGVGKCVVLLDIERKQATIDLNIGVRIVPGSDLSLEAIGFTETVPEAPAQSDKL